MEKQLANLESNQEAWVTQLRLVNFYASFLVLKLSAWAGQTDFEVVLER